MLPVAPTVDDDVRLRRWQAVTGAALLLGYMGYYVCRSNLSVATPALISEFSSRGVDRQAIGAVSSTGVFFYALGKLITGISGDFAGGRTMFLAGLFGSVAATVMFGAGSGLAVFVAAWGLNRFVQSAGWGGLVKIASHWFSAKQYGTVMAVLSLSYLFGDAVGRYVLGAFLSNGATWRTLFLIAAAILAMIGVIDVAVLRSSPRDIGCREPDVNAANVYGPAGAEGTPASLRDLLTPYIMATSFWLVCGISCGLTLIREAFNAWIPTYLVDVHGLSPGRAAQYSSLFPFIGGLSTLAAGFASDRVGRGNRIAVAAPCLLLCVASLLALAVASTSRSLNGSLWAIVGVAFWLLGPYSLLAGAVALDFGGRRGSATAAGLIDTAGYLGAVLSGFAVGRIVETSGWPSAFRALAAIAAATLVAAIVYGKRSVRS
jgi:OPA family glycerol-3-phosphate transporter-like MFS transporter